VGVRREIKVGFVVGPSRQLSDLKTFSRAILEALGVFGPVEVNRSDPEGSAVAPHVAPPAPSPSAEPSEIPHS
jgi:hypothetical protein